jgi:hypothetical protein
MITASVIADPLLTVGGKGIAVVNNILYVAKNEGVNTTGRIDTYTLDGMSLGSIFGTTVGEGEILNFAIYNNYLYVNMGLNGTNKKLGKYLLNGVVGQSDLITGISGRGTALAVYDNKIYVSATGNQTVDVYTLDGEAIPGNPLITVASGEVSGIAVDDTHIYVTNRQNGTIAKYATDGELLNDSFITDLNNPWSVLLKDDYVFVANRGDQIIVVYNKSGESVNTNLLPASFGPGGPKFMAISGNRLFVTGIEGGGTNPKVSSYELTGLPCFVAGTHILTLTGNRPVEEIQSGDHVLLADGRSVPVKVFSFTVEHADAESAPYCVKAGALGHQYPSAPYCVNAGALGHQYPSAPYCVNAGALGHQYPPHDLHVSGNHAITDSRGVWQFPYQLAKTNPNVQQYGIGESIKYYHLECPNYVTDNLVAEWTVVESFKNKQKTKRVYMWNTHIQGYTRTTTTKKNTNILKKISQRPSS